MTVEPSEPVPKKSIKTRESVSHLQEIRSSLSTVFHDANNPLAIISGNAQFLLELARTMQLDEELIQPIRDIDEASRRVADSLKELEQIRVELGRYITHLNGH
jgi:signal transduction histidine kinase